MRHISFLFPFLLLVACGGGESSSPRSSADCEESPGIAYRTDGELTFYRADGTGIGTITIEVADRDSTRARGLMARKCIPQDWGMLFVFPEERSQAFYMANTPRSLDIMYFAGDSTFVNAAKYTSPNSHDNQFSESPAKFVVETAAGFVDRHGLAPGDFIDWTLNSSVSVEPQVVDSALLN